MRGKSLDLKKFGIAQNNMLKLIQRANRVPPIHRVMFPNINLKTKLEIIFGKTD